MRYKLIIVFAVLLFTVALARSGYAPSPVMEKRDNIISKYAIVIGISDYKTISDLSYCDEDATDWYNYLVNNGYDVRVYGDTSSLYPHYDGLAKESIIKQSIQNITSILNENDYFVLIFSGHGGNDTSGYFLCAWDCDGGEDGEDGYFYDYELWQLLSNIDAMRILVFLDACESGGILDYFQQNLISDYKDLFMTATCHAGGSGYDSADAQNGMWTYWFLEKGLEGEHDDTNINYYMEDCFAWADSQYNPGGSDEPQVLDFGSEKFSILDAISDVDEDGLSDQYEVSNSLNPWNPDTDGDEINDYDEVYTYHTSPLKVDTDGDGLTDKNEIFIGTNPTNPDTDGDKLADYDEEMRYHTDPTKVDTDGDGLPDNVEINGPTSPLDPDSDDDGIVDGEDFAPTVHNAMIILPSGILVGAILFFLIRQKTMKGNLLKFSE